MRPASPHMLRPRRPVRATLSLLGAVIVLALSGCGEDENAATTTGAQDTAPASTASTPSTTSSPSSATSQSRSTTQPETAPSSTSPAAPQTTRDPKPVRSEAALEGGKDACEDKTPRQIAEQYLDDAKASNPAWAKSPQAKQLLAFLDKAPDQAQANPQLAPIAAIVYALSVKNAKERQDAFNGCVTALASTTAPPLSTTSTTEK